MPKTDDQIREDVEVFDMIEHWGGWLVAAGLVAEVVYAFVFRSGKSFWEAFTPTIANAFVALGVIMEVYFSQLGGARRDELERRSNEKVAQANERAANAELETERLRMKFGWRAISATQMSALVRTLHKSIGPVMIAHADDPESSSYAQQLIFAFRTAGWSVERHACSYEVVEFGIRAPEFQDERSGPSKTVRAALKEAGIEFESAPLPRPTQSFRFSSGPIRNGRAAQPDRFAEWHAQLYIGPKAMPWSIPDVEKMQGHELQFPIA